MPDPTAGTPRTKVTHHADCRQCQCPEAEASGTGLDADSLHAAWHREAISPTPTWEKAGNGYECYGPRSQCRVLAAARRMVADIAKNRLSPVPVPPETD